MGEVVFKNFRSQPTLEPFLADVSETLPYLVTIFSREGRSYKVEKISLFP